MVDRVVDFIGTWGKHVDDTLTRYVDFGDILADGETVTSGAAVCADDADLVIGSVSVIGTNTTVPTKTGTRTIVANQGLKFQLSGGTAIASTADPVRVKVTATLSTGEDAVGTARLRVEE